MSAATEQAEEAEESRSARGSSEQSSKKAAKRPSPGSGILGPQDLVNPLVVAAALVALYFYVSGQELDSIESNILEIGGLVDYTIAHVELSFAIAILVLLIAVPLGILVTREKTKKSAPVVLTIANIGQSAPSLGLLALVGIYFIGFWAVVLVLTAYTALAVLRNTIAGLQQVDTGVLDAAKGMGMSPAAVLLRVELPLAVPIIGAGARTALVLAVATVPLGQFLGAGGLGFPLFSAIKTDRPVASLTVAVLIACLALLLDWLAGVLQRVATPRGIR